MDVVFAVCCICVVVSPLIFVFMNIYLSLIRAAQKRKRSIETSIGFFHPYCNAGGGGERVLWTAISAIQKRYRNVHCVVYTGDILPGASILEKVEFHFNIILSRPIEFVYLKKRYLVEDKWYPYFTLLFQSLGSIILGLEALFNYVPDIYIDTMGYAWTLPIFKYLGSCKVGAYVHYPTISTDMLQAVLTKKKTVNNRFISNNLCLYLKVIYYKIFAFIYGFMGRQADVIMVNSSWTKNHILQLWKKPDCTYTVYPPCDVCQFEMLPIRRDVDKINFRILSIGQFRPEKDHQLQIKAFHAFLNRLSKKGATAALVLVGSCRHDGDYQRVKELKDLCYKLSIQQNVEFKINLTFQDVLSEMKNACIALHTMWNEHFGIGIVECMSAGLIMIAHDSGGPKMDIITDMNNKRTGFLAKDIDSYADAMDEIWKMDENEQYEIRRNARESVSRFSVSKFEDSFLSASKAFFE